jgi:PAS domain S-box-containing protein
MAGEAQEQGRARRFGGGALMEQAGAARRALREPRSERERLRTLASFRVAGTGPEPEFDAIAALATRLTQAPIAAVTFVDGRSELVKAAAGHALTAVDRSESFGGIVVERGTPLVIEDTLAEPRFAAHRWVEGAPGARFYAGVPLTAAGGLAVGTLAVLDTKPRTASPELLEALDDAAALLMPHLERRREDALAQNLTAVIGFDGRLQRVSAAFETLLGWRADEMVGHAVTDFVHPDDVDRTRARIDRIASGYRGAGGFENRYRAKDGTYRWLLWNAHVVPHEKRFYSAGKDITDRKSNEIALRESEARYRLLAENATDMIAGHDLDGTLTYVSSAGQVLSGWRADEMVGMSSYDLIHPDDHEAVDAAHKRLLERLQPVRYVYRLRRKDDSWVWVESNTRVVRDQRSRPIGLQSATRDISAIKAAVASLESAREHFRSAFDDAPVGMAIATLDMRFDRVNAAFCDLIGYSEGELIGRSTVDIAHPDDRGTMGKHVEGVIAGTRSSFTVEERVVRKDGTVVWVRIAASMMRNAPDEEQRLLAHVEDISERRRAAEELLRAREEAERANRAKSEFLSRMSHELRTPLNAVLGFAQLLESDDLSGDQRESVTRILSGGYHLLNLVNDVLDMSAIEAGHLPIATERVEVATVVRETVELMRPLASERSIRTHVELPEFDVAVLANAQRLKQVLLNLVSNAVKYSRPDADVTVAVEPAGDARLRIHVIDSGGGIPAEKVERAFLPFERLGERREVEGTGLGLPLSRSLVQAMGGTLTVESGPGGSTFTVELPVAEGAQEEPEPAGGTAGTTAGARPPAERPRRVLYIEDNPSNVALMEALVARRDDLELHAAQRGHAGIELARRLVPDVVVLDLHLPDMTGEAVIAALREDEATSGVPVVVVTADVTREHEQRLRDAGTTAYLTKPLDLARFQAELERALLRTPAQA